jgi:hypothetical protein
MGKKSSIPALYEKMRLPSTPSASSSARVEPTVRSAPVAEARPSWLSPGSMIRLPVGYVLLAAGAALILVVATYIIAFRRGESHGTDRMRTEILNRLSDDSTRPLADDPLVVLPNEANSTRSAINSSANRSTSTPPTIPLARPVSKWGPVVSEPRQKGLSYFVLAETSEAGARKIAEFCRSNGLETYVVSGKNERLRRIIALPGFEPAAQTTPEIRGLEQQIRTIGERWKKSERNATTDFRDLYAKPFTG